MIHARAGKFIAMATRIDETPCTLASRNSLSAAAVDDDDDAVCFNVQDDRYLLCCRSNFSLSLSQFFIVSLQYLIESSSRMSAVLN